MYVFAEVFLFTLFVYIVWRGFPFLCLCCLFVLLLCISLCGYFFSLVCGLFYCSCCACVVSSLVVCFHFVVRYGLFVGFFFVFVFACFVVVLEGRLSVRFHVMFVVLGLLVCVFSLFVLLCVVCLFLLLCCVCFSHPPFCRSFVFVPCLFVSLFKQCCVFLSIVLVLMFLLLLLFSFSNSLSVLLRLTCCVFFV